MSIRVARQNRFARRFDRRASNIRMEYIDGPDEPTTKTIEKEEEAEKEDNSLGQQ